VPISLNTGSAQVDRNPFPPPAKSGYYLVKITKVTEKAIASREDIIRVALNAKVVKDEDEDKATGFVQWSILNVPVDADSATKEQYRVEMNQRSLRNMLRVVAEISDEDLNSGNIVIDLEQLKDIECWCYINVRERLINGEPSKEGQIQRFVTYNDFLAAMGRLTPDAPLAASEEPEEPEEEEDEDDDSEEESEEEEEDELPVTPPPPPAVKKKKA
jgi:hypothetical protein